MAFSRILGQALVGQVLVRTCSNYFSKLICDCSCHSSRKRMWIFFQCSSSKQAVLITANHHLVYGHPWWGRHLSLRLSKVCSAVEGYGVKRQQHHVVSIRHCYVAKYLQVLHDAPKNLLVWTNLSFLLANETNKRFTLGIADFRLQITNVNSWCISKSCVCIGTQNLGPIFIFCRNSFCNVVPKGLNDVKVSANNQNGFPIKQSGVCCNHGGFRSCSLSWSNHVADMSFWLRSRLLYPFVLI